MLTVSNYSVSNQNMYNNPTFGRKMVYTKNVAQKLKNGVVPSLTAVAAFLGINLATKKTTEVPEVVEVAPKKNEPKIYFGPNTVRYEEINFNRLVEEIYPNDHTVVYEYDEKIGYLGNNITSYSLSGKHGEIHSDYNSFNWSYKDWKGATSTKLEGKRLSENDWEYTYIKLGESTKFKLSDLGGDISHEDIVNFIVRDPNCYYLSAEDVNKFVSSDKCKEEIKTWEEVKADENSFNGTRIRVATIPEPICDGNTVKFFRPDGTLHSERIVINDEYVNVRTGNTDTIEYIENRYYDEQGKNVVKGNKSATNGYFLEYTDKDLHWSHRGFRLLARKDYDGEWTYKYLDSVDDNKEIVFKTSDNPTLSHQDIVDFITNPHRAKYPSRESIKKLTPEYRKELMMKKMEELANEMPDYI